MICTAVFESDDKRKNILRDWLIRYSFTQDCELELLWFTETDPVSQIEKYAGQIQVAIVSLDTVKGEACGSVLYEKNPDCRIMYYCETPYNVEQLLPTRPISFYLMSKGQEDFQKKMLDICTDLLLSETIFRYEAKRKLYLIPKRNILYFQSDLRYVNVCLQCGNNPKIISKLSDIETIVGKTFIRIHKSYLVNPQHILWLDKNNHMVVLKNGEELPVSDAQYDMVCERIRKY